MKWIVVIYWISKRWQTLCVCECVKGECCVCSGLSLDLHDPKNSWTHSIERMPRSQSNISKYFAEMCNHFWVIISVRCCRCCFQWHKKKKNWIEYYFCPSPIAKWYKFTLGVHNMLSGNLQFRCHRHRLSISLSAVSQLKFFNANINILVAFNASAPKKLLLSDQALCVFSFKIWHLKLLGCCKQQQKNSLKTIEL